MNLTTKTIGTVVGDLRVELYGHLVGHLVRRDPRAFVFQAERSAIENFGLGSTIMSESVPLDLIPNRSHADRQRNYFAELLPEGQILSALAARIRADENNVIALLANYGRDVAGAVQIYDPDRPGEPRTPYSTPINVAELEALLLNVGLNPLGNTAGSGKSSLAGVQQKIVVALIDDVWHLVHDGYPSTHIIKPETHAFPTMIFDEEYGCRIARHLGLARHETRITMFNSVAGLVIERYDRTPDRPPARIHQEDMNQALGAAKSEKYQENGGKVTLQRIAHVFAKDGNYDSLERLLILNTLSVAIGNFDLHAKNISILHFQDGSSEMAPAYDVVPMRHMDNDHKMALSFNGQYVHSQIAASDIVEEAHSWQMATDPQPIVARTLEQISEFVETASPHERAHPTLVYDITTFVKNLQNKKPAGTAQI